MGDRRKALAIRRSRSERSHSVYETARTIAIAAQILFPADVARVESLNQLAYKFRPTGMRSLTLRKSRALRLFENHACVARLRASPATVYADYEQHSTWSAADRRRLKHHCMLQIMVATPLVPGEVARLRLSDLRPHKAGGLQISISSEQSNQAGAKLGVLIIVGQEAAVLRTYINRVRSSRPGSDTIHLFPGQTSCSASAATVARVSALLASQCLGDRIVATDLRHGIAYAAALHPKGGPAIERAFLGRTTCVSDPVIAAAEARLANWRQAS